jgi:DNA-binding transcriptional regulator YhcF (GntR family)
MRDRILQGEWQPGERIPSIRELAVDIGVNPNTVTKSYQSLMERDIIENQRGLGYFVSTGARDKILADLKDEFIREELPRVFNTMRLLEMEIDELAQHYNGHSGGRRDEN